MNVIIINKYKDFLLNIMAFSDINYFVMVVFVERTVHCLLRVCCEMLYMLIGRKVKLTGTSI